MEVFLIVWIVIGLLMIAGSLFYVGYDKRDGFDRENFIFNSIMLAMLWPIILSVVVCIAPFYGIYLLGKYFASRRNDI